MNFSLKTSFIPNKNKSNYFKANYFFNINKDMLNHLERAGLPTTPSLQETDYLNYNKIINADGQWIGMSSDLLPKSQSYSLKNKSLKLEGYKFEGWAKVRNRHNVLAHPQSSEQAQLYAGPSSVIHRTRVYNPSFLWKPQENHKFEPIGQIYDFHAQWTPIKYAISYSARTIWDEPLDWTHPKGIRSIEQGYISQAKAKLPYYQFVGWKVDDEPLSKEQLIIPSGIGSVEIVAIFEQAS
ncbi:hypothetical protein [Lactococcus garvieae]|jgi:hypothetical protein|uniref:hypothetical protein n=1 Tax=Lactococcus garvieae TaxID=1363 RepID=UPI0009BC9B94|nr:hypothetical protein [Lactococcus garvieae]